MSEVQSGRHAYGRDQVIRIINSVLTKVERQGEDVSGSVYQELKELKTIIEEARQEMGVTRPDDIKDKHIPTATDELDAVVEATAEATGKIMDSCESIQEIVASVSGDAANSLEAEVIKIFEACSFQDITGQRITKVVSTLKTIEQKVDGLVSAMGPHRTGAIQSEQDDQRAGEAALLNGPQMAGDAISQEEIDRLLEEFD